jgi:hypothetical protein
MIRIATQKQQPKTPSQAVVARVRPESPVPKI